MDELFGVITESILGKIEEGAIEVKGNPGIKVGTEKYIGMKQSYQNQLEKTEKLIIGKSDAKKRSRCCGK